ncbi:ABC transporter substrate-binding protein [Corynebacterium sp.]|uniref:ABC transporter substrate-binding protein n=1 Tax=Corynebacterium sp. TaxID=1720 RepID=UPI0025C55F44|nr:ABC transporter substrate-binding protein [Corynebacterium sp.]
MNRNTVSVVLASSLLLASCGAPSQDAALSVDNCGDSVPLDGVPDNVTLLKPAAVSTLSALGVLDHVTHRAGKYPDSYYDDATSAVLDGIPSITDRTDDSGHLQISREEVVASGADLVLGETDTVNRQTLAGSGIPLIEEPAFCGAIDGDVTWDDVWDQVRLYGTVFDREDRADEVVRDLRHRLDAVRDRADAPGTGRSVAVLYPTAGGGVTYAYGTGSMAAPVVAATGASNVYADQGARVFDVSAEDIVDRDPDVIVALYSSGDGDSVVDEVNRIPGIDRTTAGRERHILPMLLNYAEPPTPLALDGVDMLDDYLRGLT